MFQDTERTFHVEKDRLMTTLVANRDGHKAKVEAARKAWEEQLTEAIRHALKQAEKGHASRLDSGVLNFTARFPIPQDYTREYDRAIDRLEWMDEDKVELNQIEFNQFVRDEWDWTERFVASNSLYNVS